MRIGWLFECGGLGIEVWDDCLSSALVLAFGGFGGGMRCFDALLKQPRIDTTTLHLRDDAPGSMQVHLLN